MATIYTPTHEQWGDLSSRIHGLDRENFSSDEWTDMWADPIPTLLGLKEALQNNDKSFYKIGTEIADTWDGKDSPLLVGTYTTISDADGNSRRAVGLMRKYASDDTVRFSRYDADYANSEILTNLNGDYLSKCSDELKAVVSPVKVKWYNGSKLIDVPGTWHLPSNTGVMGISGGDNNEDEPWEYWKKLTGLTEPTNKSVETRLAYRADGNATYIWTRSRYNNTSAHQVYWMVMNNAVSSQRSYQPICYILAD